MNRLAIITVIIVFIVLVIGYYIYTHPGTLSSILRSFGSSLSPPANQINTPSSSIHTNPPVPAKHLAGSNQTGAFNVTAATNYDVMGDNNNYTFNLRDNASLSLDVAGYNNQVLVKSGNSSRATPTTTITGASSSRTTTIRPTIDLTGSNQTESFNVIAPTNYNILGDNNNYTFNLKDNASLSLDIVGDNNQVVVKSGNSSSTQAASTTTITGGSLSSSTTTIKPDIVLTSSNQTESFNVTAATGYVIIGDYNNYTFNLKDNASLSLDIVGDYNDMLVKSGNLSLGITGDYDNVTINGTNILSSDITGSYDMIS